MECSFCGNEVEKGKGYMYVKANGTVYFFCSSKCKANMLKLKRKARKFKWTKKYEKAKKA